MSKSESSTHTGLARWPGISATRWRYRGTSGSRAATSAARTSPLPAGRSRISIPPTCIGVSGSSRYRKDASSVVSRSTIGLLTVGGSRYGALRIGTPHGSSGHGSTAPPPPERQGNPGHGCSECAELTPQHRAARHLRERPTRGPRRVDRAAVGRQEESHLTSCEALEGFCDLPSWVARHRAATDLIDHHDRIDVR